MATTYTPIATQTLTGTSSLVTFSSIPNTYTDLRLVGSFQDSGEAAYIRLNSNGGTNYSRTLIYGYTSGVFSVNSADIGSIPFGGAASGSYFDISTLDIMSYSNTSILKTCLMRQNSVQGIFVAAHSILFDSTSAISQIDIHSTSANSLKAGSTFTLYGIKAA